MSIHARLSLFVVAMLGCADSAPQDTCGDWTAAAFAEAFEFGDEIDCGQTGTNSTEAEANAVFECMSAALEAGDPAVASFFNDYEDDVYDLISEHAVVHVRRPEDEPRIVEFWQVHRTPEDGPSDYDADATGCEALVLVDGVNDDGSDTTWYKVSCKRPEDLCPD